MDIPTGHQTSQRMIDDHTGGISRAEYLRSTPLSAAERDLLTGLTSDMPSELSFPPLPEIVSVFQCAQKVPRDILEPLSICSTSACQLAMVLLSVELNAHRTDQIRAGVQVYLTELQRLSGSLFSLDHPFWAVYYQSTAPLRLVDQTAIRLDRNSTSGVVLGIARSQLRVFLVPLEIVFLSSTKTNQLSYEMLRQSLVAVLGAHLLYAVQADSTLIRSQLTHAIRLSARLELPGYDAWQSGIMQHLLKNHMS